jgi:Carboxypeptidase regulatory-like domain
MTMTRQLSLAALAALLCVPSPTVAQTSYRLKGTVKNEKGAPVAGARVRAAALQGFRGEQFVGQKEFATATTDKGEWNILGLTSGIWTFEATAANYAPNVIVLPVQYTQRKMQSATGGQLSWDLPITLASATNGMLKAASEAAAAGKTDEAISLAGGVAGDADMQTVCSGGHVALLTRQYSLASAMFREVVKRDAKHPCASLGLASAALMQGDVLTAGKLFWDAREVIPASQKRAVAAAIGDLQQIAGMKQ